MPLLASEFCDRSAGVDLFENADDLRLGEATFLQERVSFRALRPETHNSRRSGSGLTRQKPNIKLAGGLGTPNLAASDLCPYGHAPQRIDFVLVEPSHSSASRRSKKKSNAGYINAGIENPENPSITHVYSLPTSKSVAG